MIRLTAKFDVSLFVFLIIVLLVPNSFAESNDIPITLGNQNIEIDFDGKWSFTAEWKASSLNEIKTDLGPIYLRTFHLGNFIYVMIDAVADKTIDKGYDKATICFDSKNEKSITPDENDYCFSVTLGKKNPTTFRGNQQLKEFEIIDNPSGLIAVADASDENDRYTSIPHSSYEFKIPIEPLERKDVYGFYVEVYDESSSQSFSWPPEIETNLLSNIPSPQKWGIIWSPDKSLPEFELPLVTMMFGIVAIIFISKKIVRLNSLFRF